MWYDVSICGIMWVLPSEVCCLVMPHDYYSYMCNYHKPNRYWSYAYQLSYRLHILEEKWVNVAIVLLTWRL